MSNRAGIHRDVRGFDPGDRTGPRVVVVLAGRGRVGDRHHPVAGSGSHFGTLRPPAVSEGCGRNLARFGQRGIPIGLLGLSAASSVAPLVARDNAAQRRRPLLGLIDRAVARSRSIAVPRGLWLISVRAGLCALGGGDCGGGVGVAAKALTEPGLRGGPVEVGTHAGHGVADSGARGRCRHGSK